MYRKRAQNVKRCEFRKFKEWAKDYMGEHDITQMEMIQKQLVKLRNEEKKCTNKKVKKLHVTINLDNSSNVKSGVQSKKTNG